MSRSPARGPGLISGLLLVVLPASAAAEAHRPGGLCIDPAVAAAVQRCEGGAEGSAEGGRAPASRLEPRRAAAEKAAPAATPGLAGPGTAEGGDEVAARLRSREILVRQIGLARGLVERTRAGDPELPARLSRLASLQEELLRALQRDARTFDEPIFAAEQRGAAAEARGLRREQGALEGQARTARAAAIGTVRRLAEDFPDAGDHDEALALWAGLLEDQAEEVRRSREAGAGGAGQPSEGELREAARRVFRDLIRAHPASPHVPRGYLSFAEHYFDEGQMQEALRFYEKVASYAGSSVRGYALYKSAWCHVNLGEDPEAVSAFVDVLELGRASPGSPLAGPLARQSRREIIPPLARAFPEARAFELFARVAPGHEVEMMELLAEHLFDQGQWADAAAAYHTLMARAPASDGLCRYQARAAECALRTSPPDAALLELRRTVDLGATFVAGAHDDAVERGCRATVAGLVLEVATAWHQEAAGTERAPGTSDAATFERASALYRLALDGFPDLDELDLEGWAEGRRPTRAGVAYYRGEALFALHRDDECGPAFDGVLDEEAADELRADASYGAALCYDRAYAARAAREPEPRGPAPSADAEDVPAPRPLTDLEGRMVAAFERAACLAPAGDEQLRLTFRRASVLYDAARFEEAAPLFMRVVELDPASELAPIAAHRYLDAANAVGRREPGRASACLDALEAAVERFRAEERLVEDEEFVRYLGPIHAGILWRRAEASEAAGDRLGCARLHGRILQLYEGRVDDISGHGMDEVLYNQALCYEADARIGAAIETRLRLIRDYGEGSAAAEALGRPSPWAARAEYQVAGNYHAIAAYTKAAERYEDFARRFPGEPQAADALVNATVFRIGLGQHDEALENGRLFERAFAARRAHADKAAPLLLALGDLLLKRGQPREAEGLFSRFLARYGKTAPVDEQIAVRVRLGRALEEGGGRGADRALREHRAAVDLADRRRAEGEALAARVARYRGLVEGRGSTAAERERDQTARVARVLEDVSRARFALAEAARERFEAVALEPFHASRGLSRADREFWTKTVGREGVAEWEGLLSALTPDERRRQIAQVHFARWVHEAWGLWLGRREEARRDAEALYLRVLEEGVPGWVVAASSRLGDMHRATMDAIYAVPMPPAVAGDPELEEEWERQVDEAAEPHQRAAILAYERCLTTATRNRWFDERSRACETALNRLSPRGYPLSDELRADPVYVASPLAAPTLLGSLQRDDDE